jgi:hypothetical protein
MKRAVLLAMAGLLLLVPIADAVYLSSGQNRAQIKLIMKRHCNQHKVGNAKCTGWRVFKCYRMNGGRSPAPLRSDSGEMAASSIAIGVSSPWLIDIPTESTFRSPSAEVLQPGRGRSTERAGIDPKLSPQSADRTGSHSSSA